MKILHLARLYYPHVGGVETHLAEINKRFVKKKHQVVVITSQHDRQLKKAEQVDGVKILRIEADSELNEANFVSKNIAKFKLWKQIFNHYRRFLEADVIHVHDVMWWILPIYPAIWQKVFITFHGYEGDDLPTYNQVFWHRFNANLAKANLCIGGFHQKWYGVKPTATVFGAVEREKRLIKKSSVKIKKNKIIFLGRLSNDNGILTYLEALKICAEKNRAFDLDVFGDGPLFSQAKKYANKHNLKVAFHGFDANARDKIYLYDLVFASRYLSIIESLSVGKKIIAQYNNQLQHDYLSLSPFKKWIEIFQKPEEIADYLLHFQTSPKDHKKIEVGKKWANQQTWEKLTDTYFELWK